MTDRGHPAAMPHHEPWSAPARGLATGGDPIEALSGLWRRLFLLALPFGVLALVLGLIFEVAAGRASPFDAIVYRAMIVGLIGLEFVALVWPKTLRTVITISVVGTGAFFLAKLAFLLFALPAGLDPQHELAETFFWVPAVYLLSFLVPDGRGGRILSATFTGAVLGMSALYAVTPLLNGGLWGMAYALTEMNLANSVQLALTFTLIGLKEAYARVTVERHLAQSFANQDLLTGLPNRRALETDLAALIARDPGGRAAVLFLDLDGFKVINDTLGHEAGDALLKLVAERLHGAMRDGDLVARMSGDEFVVVANGLRSRAEASEIARRIFAALSQPFGLNDSELGLTVSVGVAFLPEDGDDARTLLRHADSAMYRVKRSGKNGLKYYSPDIDASLERRGELERDLRTALRDSQISLAYQPVFDMRDGSLRQVEALMRWHHPRYGLVPPSEFIPLAEESGAIVALGSWALQEACRQLGSWRAQSPGLRVSVNVSALQLAQPSFFGSVVKALQDAGLSADALELDLGEGVMRGGFQDVQGTLRGLRGLGVGIALDDFGRGFSSLAHLRDLPIDAVKIASDVVHDLGGSEGLPRFGLAMMEAVLGLARHLDLTIVAEGVETRAQFERLFSLGCHRAQGFFFAPPMPAADVTGLVALGGASTVWDRATN